MKKKNKALFHNHAVFFKKFNLHNYLQQMVDSSTQKRQNILNHIDKAGGEKIMKLYNCWNNFKTLHLEKKVLQFIIDKQI